MSSNDREPSDVWTSPFQRAMGDTVINTTPIHTSPTVIGTPQSDQLAWPGQQEHQDTCAIRCQQYIIDQYTGQNVSENTLVNEAAAHGWYTPGGGTSEADVGKLLEEHNIPVHRYVNANIFQLSNELAQGHKVIVGVDSAELWHNTSGGNSILHDILEKLGLENADHAVVVSGIDTSDPAHVQVIVSDPGTGEPAARYPLEQFVDAWKDSSFYMVATDQPAPATLPEMANFDYAAGHIPTVWGIPYADFAALSESSDAWALNLEPFLPPLDDFTPDGLHPDETNPLDAPLHADPFDQSDDGLDGDHHHNL